MEKLSDERLNELVGVYDGRTMHVDTSILSEEILSCLLELKNLRAIIKNWNDDLEKTIHL